MKTIRGLLCLSASSLLLAIAAAAAAQQSYPSRPVRVVAEVAKLAATPDYRQQLEKQGFEPFTSSPEQFSAYLKAEVEKWGKVIKALGIKPS